MSRFSIVIVDFDYPDVELERKIIEAAGGSLAFAHATTEDEVINAAEGADGVINQYAAMTERVFASLPRCRVVSRYGIGVDTIDLQAATNHEIVVCNVPDYCLEEVSNDAMALMLALCRKTKAADEQVKSGGWDFSQITPILAAEACTFGIVGLGNIGRRMARKAKALGYRCVACDPYLDDEVFAHHGVRRLSLGALLETSDIVSLHTPLTRETFHFIGERELKRMKPSAFLINTSRGRVIDQKALCSAMSKGWIAGAGLDVLEQEPPDPDDPLLSLNQVIITPHIAFYSEESIIRLRTITAESAVKVLDGQMPHAVVNPDVLARIRLNRNGHET